MFQQVKTQLSPSKRTFHYGNPFESCLIIKNWNPQNDSLTMSMFHYYREKTHILTYAVKDFSSMNPFLVTDSFAKIR